MNAIKKVLILLFVVCIAACSEDTIDTFGTGTITGKVVLSGENAPIENVKISTSPSTSTVFTDENGEFVLNDVEEGEYSVQAEKDGYLTAFEGANVKTGLEVNVIFELNIETANNKQPSAPVLIAPADGADDQELSVQFIWNAEDNESDELTYELEIKNSANNNVLRFTEIKDTTYTVDNLSYGLKYFWQVKVSDSINDPVLSEVSSFTTSKTPTFDYLFVKVVDGNNVIFSIDSDGNESQITSSSYNSFRPILNSDASKLAFYRTVAGKTQLFVMNLDGSDLKQLTSSISPKGIDNERLGFSWADNDASLIFPSYDKIYKVGANGGSSQLFYTAAGGRYILDIDQSADRSKVAILETNISGYEGTVYVIDASGATTHTVISGVTGTVGGVDISVDGSKVLYTHDISGYESDSGRQLNSRMYTYRLSDGAVVDVSAEKTNGTNDTDVRFSSNESLVLFVNSSSSASSGKVMYVNISADGLPVERTQIAPSGKMPNQ